MESYSKKLTSLIKSLHEHPDPETNISIMKCLVELWETKESVLVPTRTDEDGDIYLLSLKPNSGKNKNSAFLLTETDIDGQECNRVIFDEEWLVCFTEERFFYKKESVSLMYGEFETLIECFKEEEERYLGIVVNPYHEEYVLYLTASSISVLFELRDSYRKSKESIIQKQEGTKTNG